MINFFEHINLIFYPCEVPRAHLVLVDHFNGDFKVRVLFVSSLVHFTEGPTAQALWLDEVRGPHLPHLGLDFHMRRLWGRLQLQMVLLVGTGWHHF